MVAVTDREGVGQGVVEGQVLTGEVAHRDESVGGPVSGQVRGDEARPWHRDSSSGAAGPSCG